MKNFNRIIILVGLFGLISAPAFAVDPVGKPNENPTCTGGNDDVNKKVSDKTTTTIHKGATVDSANGQDN